MNKNAPSMGDYIVNDFGYRKIDKQDTEYVLDVLISTKSKKSPEFFLDCEKRGMTFKQMGELLGVTKQQAHYLFNQALHRGKKYSQSIEGLAKKRQGQKKRWTVEAKKKLSDALKK